MQIQSQLQNGADEAVRAIVISSAGFDDSDFSMGEEDDDVDLRSCPSSFFEIEDNSMPDMDDICALCGTYGRGALCMICKPSAPCPW